MKGRDRKKDLKKLADEFLKNLMRDNCEYGGWGLDDKRPFGNSSVDLDILEIIGEQAHKCRHGEEFTEEQCDYANGLYDELGEFIKKHLKFEFINP